MRVTSMKGRGVGEFNGQLERKIKNLETVPLETEHKVIY